MGDPFGHLVSCLLLLINLVLIKDINDLFSRTRTTVHPGGDPRPGKVHACPPLALGKRSPLLVFTLEHAIEGIVCRNLEKGYIFLPEVLSAFCVAQYSALVVPEWESRTESVR